MPLGSGLIAATLNFFLSEVRVHDGEARYHVTYRVQAIPGKTSLPPRAPAVIPLPSTTQEDEDVLHPKLEIRRTETVDNFMRNNNTPMTQHVRQDTKRSDIKENPKAQSNGIMI
ncbi:MAG: hypothetical protein M1813_000011 [Trichoglossum hirsutum]|nr:MAG: hypothetical protein M1813_000011 [Trichoglossum hirsutum]